MKKILAIIWLFVAALPLSAQMQDPVHFRSELKKISDTEAELLFSATIDAGWHVYSTNLGSGGPISATFGADKMEGAETVGGLKARGKEQKKFDKLFDMEVRFFEHNVTFVQKIKFTKPKYDIDCYVEYGACSDEMCLPPTSAELKASGTVELTSKNDQQDKAPNQENASDTLSTAPNQQDAVRDSSAVYPSSDLWQPVVDELRALGDSSTSLSDQSLLYILLMGFVGGLLAVCMPCIWPIIPMTVSFFLKRAKTDKRKGIRDAITYGISIIVIYLGLGLVVTALFGSDTLNAMSTNAVFNIFLFILLVIFALSFFGWFEIRLPDSWANKIDQKSEELSAKAVANSSLFTFHSSLSIFLMAFTLVLVSFSCTAPIIGLLLVPTMAIPDIADNSSLREAQARLKAMGFKLGPVQYVAGDKDWVYGVKCQGRNVYAGDRVPVDALLVLQVGNSAGDYDEYDGEEEEEAADESAADESLAN